MGVQDVNGLASLLNQVSLHMELVVDYLCVCVHSVEEIASVGELDLGDLRLIVVSVYIMSVTDILQWLVHQTDADLERRHKVGIEGPSEATL